MTDSVLVLKKLVLFDPSLFKWRGLCPPSWYWSQRNQQLFQPSCWRLIINSSPGKSTVCPLFTCWQSDSSGTCALPWGETGNVAHKPL